MCRPPGVHEDLVPKTHKPWDEVTPDVPCSADNKDPSLHTSIVCIFGCFEKVFGVKWSKVFSKKGVGFRGRLEEEAGESFAC